MYFTRRSLNIKHFKEFIWLYVGLTEKKEMKYFKILEA